MKKTILSAVLAVSMLLMQGHTPASFQSPVAKEQPAGQGAAQQSLFLYFWFADPDYNDFTGSIATISGELYRLRNLYPLYVFSSSPGIGLLQFEFGYHPILNDVVIYSNLNW